MRTVVGYRQDCNPQANKRKNAPSAQSYSICINYSGWESFLGPMVTVLEERELVHRVGERTALNGLTTRAG